ncbi:minor capsid protein [Leifsonia sp. WHRI 6310E]|uniref:minor capsid protein n=1 Tax=Leifsonia sp. WHRI 6310E TaxID=3162562 RepID=UPI0032EC9332
MSYTTDVLEGMAADIDAAGLGVYRGPDGQFARDEEVRAIVFSRMPEFPDEAIVLTRFGDHPAELAINEAEIQIRYRVRSPLAGERLADDLRDLFHDRTHVTYGAALFNRIKQAGFGPLGVDTNDRYEYSHNFVLTGNRYRTNSP